MIELLYRKQPKAVASCLLAGILASGLYIFSAFGLHTKDLVAGHATIIDGDTLDVAGKRIRLSGIDAPELSQRCPGGPHAQSWPAGRSAKRLMMRLIGRRHVQCQISGRGTYGRLLARCHAGRIDLNAEMVRRGMAWAFRKYSHAYVADELHARQNELGIWNTTGCQPAWEYRRQRWASGP